MLHEANPAATPTRGEDRRDDRKQDLWLELAVECDTEAVEPVSELFARYGFNQGVVIEEPFTQEPDGDNLAVDPTRPITVRTFLAAADADPTALDEIRRALWHLGRLRHVGELALAGIYYFRRTADLYAAIDEQMRRGIRLKNEYFLADAVQLMVDGGAAVITAPISVWEDCGNAESLLGTNRYLLEHQPPAVTPRQGAVIVPPSFVAEDATLERAVVGPFASVGAGAVVRDAVVRDAILEDGAVVETGVVEHTILGRKARVAGRAARLNVGDNGTVEL